jgi:hypothetical protein
VDAASTSVLAGALAGSVQTWLLINVPAGLLIAGIVAGCIGFSLAGLVVVRGNVELRQLEAHQDVAGFILAVVGVVYAVLLAFVVVIVWQQFDAARAEVDREATIVLALYQDAAALDGLGPDARPQIRRYAELVVEDEWPQMAKNQRESRRTEDGLNEIWTAFRAMEPRTDNEVAFYDAAVRSLHELSEVRRARIANSSSELLTALWAVLIAGGIISVAFTYFFGVRNLAAQALMVSALAALIGLVLALILSLDLPFTGGASVSPDRMRDAIEEFDHIPG